MDQICKVFVMEERAKKRRRKPLSEEETERKRELDREKELAEPTKKRLRKPLSEEEKERKRELDRERAHTRVNLGNAFTAWRELKEREGCKTDADLAMFLLDFHKRWKTSTPDKTPSKSTPLPVSTIPLYLIKMASKQDGDGKVVTLKSRTDGDCDTPDPSEDFHPFPDEHRIKTEEDLIGKRAHITYNDNLISLATRLRLPVHKCNYVDKLSGQRCPGEPPFHVVLKSQGTGAVLDWLCPYGHRVWSWNSQPTLKLDVQGGDFMLSTNILLSGSSYRKVALLFSFMGMGMVAESTFFRIQDSYCKGPILKYWEQTRAEVIERLRHKDSVVLLGDGRMDSPGRTANVCTYTTIEQESRDIVYIDSIDNRATGRSSVIMETESFCHAMDALLPDLKIKEMVTNANPHIAALLHPARGKYKGIQHSLDVWHAAKSLRKKLQRAGTENNQTELKVWTRDIVNHFWYCSRRAKTEEEFMLMWVGILHHVYNQHSWATGRCEHGPLADNGRNKPWMKRGSEAHQVLGEIVLEKRWLTQVKKCIRFRSTSDLESFQNHMLTYAPKCTSYTLDNYKVRTCLAAIDYNKHNRHRPAPHKDGIKICKRSYNNKSMMWSVQTMKERKSYSYVPEIQKAILVSRLQSQTAISDDP